MKRFLKVEFPVFLFLILFISIWVCILQYLGINFSTFRIFWGLCFIVWSFVLSFAGVGFVISKIFPEEFTDISEDEESQDENFF